jgi:hypothetical protein
MIDGIWTSQVWVNEFRPRSDLWWRRSRGRRVLVDGHDGLISSNGRLFLQRCRRLRVGRWIDRLVATFLLGLHAASASESIVVIIALVAFDEVNNTENTRKSNFDFTLPAMDTSHWGTLGFRRQLGVHDVLGKEARWKSGLYICPCSVHQQRNYKQVYPNRCIGDLNAW